MTIIFILYALVEKILKELPLFYHLMLIYYLTIFALGLYSLLGSQFIDSFGHIHYMADNNNNGL